MGGDFAHVAVVRAKKRNAAWYGTEAPFAIKKEEQCHGRNIFQGD